ncbi:MAG: DM13 domain-containing protein [Acidobacteria bacterium]|nr:DM13 domain-containing protein [Acidobacteriota bacterium]
MRKTVLILAGLAVLLGGWYLFRPELLFVKTTVNESFPAASTATAGGPAILAMGSFHGVAHETRGTATLYQLPDGKRVVRFTNFETSNGPDVQVYLVAAPDATDSETVTKAGFIHLGALKGTTGDQNYDVPADADLAKYQSVTVWCRRFSVNFGTAPLR